MIPSMAIMVGFWIAFEASGNRNLGLAKGILVGLYLVCFTFSSVMNAFGATVRHFSICSKFHELTFWQYASEIMPTEIRAAGVASGYFVFNALAVLMAQITPLAIDKITWRYFVIFLVMDCIFIVIAYLFYPETKGMTLEKVGEAFGDKVVDIVELDLGENELRR
jgi:hypothetical protein